MEKSAIKVIPWATSVTASPKLIPMSKNIILRTIRAEKVLSVPSSGRYQLAKLDLLVLILSWEYLWNKLSGIQQASDSRLTFLFLLSGISSSFVLSLSSTLEGNLTVGFFRIPFGASRSAWPESERLYNICINSTKFRRRYLQIFRICHISHSVNLSNNNFVKIFFSE